MSVPAGPKLDFIEAAEVSDGLDSLQMIERLFQ
jgi:hypothetical protein